MAGLNCSSINPSKLHSANQLRNAGLVRSLYALSNQDYGRKEFKVGGNLSNNYNQILISDSCVFNQCWKSSIFSTASMNVMMSRRSFSSSSGDSKVYNKTREVSATSVNVGNSCYAGIDWTDGVTDVSITLLVWLVMPKLLKWYNYSTNRAQYWDALYLGWWVSLVWFLYRWLKSLFSRVLDSPNLSLREREMILTFDKIYSFGLFGIGTIIFAEVCPVAVQPIGVILGVASVFAVRNVIRNVLSGLSLQFSKPFSLGDTIKVGSVEGQVVEIGLTNTVLLSPEKVPFSVSNSLFSSQVIVNKSRRMQSQTNE